MTYMNNSTRVQHTKLPRQRQVLLCLREDRSLRQGLQVHSPQGTPRPVRHRGHWPAGNTGVCRSASARCDATVPKRSSSVSARIVCGGERQRLTNTIQGQNRRGSYCHPQLHVRSDDCETVTITVSGRSVQCIQRPALHSWTVHSHTATPRSCAGARDSVRCSRFEAQSAQLPGI